MARGDDQRIRHLGLNAVFLQPRMGGLETYLRELTPALLEVRPDLRISMFVNADGAELLRGEPWIDGVELVQHPLLGRRYTRALTETTLLGWLASRRSLDVLHSVALTAPLVTKPANVLTIPDVIWLRQPDPAEMNTVRLWRLFVPRVARRVDRIITLSGAAKREIAEDFEIPDERIDVIHCGPGTHPLGEGTPERELRSRYGLGDGPIVLAVSALKVHKNIGALVEALAEVRKTAPDAVLVLPGNPTPQVNELGELATRLGIGDAVVFPGWASEDELEGLYRAAACYVLPSFREGFGLPVLEAMRRGTPVVCADSSAIPEVAGDAALYFDPHRPDELASAIRRILESPALAEELSAKGSRRVREFTWRRAAEQTLESYKRALAAA